MYLHQLTPSVILLLSLKYGAKAQDFSFIPPEAGEVANFNMQLFNDCLGVAQRPQCHPFVDHPVCIKNLCTNCKTYSKIIANCCSTGDPASCLDAQAGVADMETVAQPLRRQAVVPY
ncbi:MAG: hypothetical protein M1838_004766 [Thelocarpon superellum]|nr:MAG: hypothetical protein M1838_004766 [Thelocarpon superellum]